MNTRQWRSGSRRATFGRLLGTLTVAVCVLALGVGQAAADDPLTGMTGGSAPHENRQPGLAINHIISLEGIYPSRNSETEPLSATLGYEATLGEISLFGGNYAPRGWALCDGQTLPINQYQSLFSILGTTYGGDGRTTFALPDLRGRTVVHPGQGPGLSNYTLGQRGGTETVTLAESEIPSHQHTLPPSANLTYATGGGQTHENRQPYLATNRIIALVGTFPSRSSEGEAASTTLGVAMPVIGEVTTFAGNYAPRDWAFCDGQLLSISSYTALFAIIGTTYGGDGRTTFALPDLRSRATMHAGQGPGLTRYQLGERSGVERAPLSIAQMPSHQHTLPPSSDLTGLTGGGGEHENVQPSLALNYIVALTGVYPSRNSESDALPASLGIGDPFVGEISLFAGNFAPRGWALCDGQLLAISSNDALFSIFGTTYGGDGRTTFGLPDLRGRIPVQPGQGAGLSNYYLGQRFGLEDVTLTQSELASHLHVVPEPATLSLLALGGLVALRRRRRC